MNDTINSVSSSQSKTSITAASSSINSSQDGRNGVDISNSSASETPFQDSIQKAYDDSLQDVERTEPEPGGNDLPVSNNLPDSTADDDRLLSIADFNIQSHLSDQVPAQNKTIAKETITHNQSALPDIEVNVADELSVLSPGASHPARIEVNVDEVNVLSPQLRQLLKVEPNVNAKKTQLTTSNITGANDTIEKPLLQQTDILSLNTEQAEIHSHKNQLLATAIQQQQMLSNSQTSLLSQTVSAQGESNIDSLPLLLNPSANNFSTINLQSIPQAEIVETFARPAWSQGMGKQILLMVNQNISSAEIRLNPAHLGPIEVLIDMSEDQVSVSLSSRHAVVREAMEQALPKLREMLDDKGFNLAETDISQHSFTEQREQNTENNNKGSTGDRADQSVSSEISEQVIKHLSTSAAMVDYYI